MDTTRNYYVPWLGELRYLRSTGFWYLSNVEDLRYVEFDIEDDRRLRPTNFYGYHLSSPFPLVSDEPVEPQLLLSHLKDPFRAPSTPIPPPSRGWAWSPLIGWCFTHSSPRDQECGIWVPQIEVGPFTILPAPKSEPDLKVSFLWGRAKTLEFCRKTPLYSAPKKFSFPPLKEKAPR